MISNYGSFSQFNLNKSIAGNNGPFDAKTNEGWGANAYLNAKSGGFSYTKETPILMLTALGMIQDKVQGFNSGVDDYLVKPFELEELKVRVKALLRRSRSTPESLKTPEILSVGDFTLVPESLTVKVSNCAVKLTPIEFEILSNLIQHHGQVVSSGNLLKEIWGYSKDDDVETIRVHIRHLRSKIEKASYKNYIETIYGGGYKFMPGGIEKVK